MAYAIKIGTTQATWIDAGATPDGCVRYEGALVFGPPPESRLLMRWDDASQNIRPFNDAELLAEAQAAAVARINAERRRQEEAGFEFGGRRIDSEERSFLRMMGAAQAAGAALAAGAPFALDWTCEDNSALPLDASGIIGMVVAFTVRAKAIHEHAQALKADVAALGSVAECAAFDVSAGWPA